MEWVNGLLPDSTGGQVPSEGERKWLGNDLLLICGGNIL